MTTALVNLVADALLPPAAPVGHTRELGDDLALVAAGLATARRHALALGLPVPELSGHLYRPLVVLAGARAAGCTPDERLWLAALAIQLAHEASLLHDDVIDGAATRRGAPTLAGRHGVARALVEGDHLLTTAYRLAAETESAAFMRQFAIAVERTVAGEKRQAAARGEVLDWNRYRDIVRGKSGELFGCALAAAATIAGTDAAPFVTVGRRVGSVYQMVDDLIDYCPAAVTGKPPLNDYHAGLWTWPLLEAGPLPRDLAPEALRRRLFSPLPASSMRRSIARLTREMEETLALLPDDAGRNGIVGTLFAGWTGAARDAVRAEERILARAKAQERVSALAGHQLLAGVDDWRRYFARHGRTFRFAARLFPPEARDRVAAVYAFCRFTDDLVDRQTDLPPATRHALLDAWRDAAWRAYQGEPTGVSLLDSVMGDMARHGVPFRYADDLIAGARMDLDQVAMSSVHELRLYTYRVASTVGLWLTELFGVRDPAVLERAAALGHAMQLTNILRDVGEDLARGRMYLPADLLARHGISVAQLDAARRSADTPLPPGYGPAVEELMELAERQYAYAFAAIPALPAFFRRPVAVAARAYEGIHNGIRANGYDNLRRRARTTLLQKLGHAARGLAGLRATQARRSVETARDILTAS